MGVVNSKIEEDKALVLCRERKRYIRQALDKRCLLADAHVSYIQSLRSTGSTLTKFVVPEVSIESSLYTSVSATSEHPAFTDKSASQFSKSSKTLSHNVKTTESFSPASSPLSSGKLHASHMKSGRVFSTKVEEKPPTPVSVTPQTPTRAKKVVLQSADNSSSDSPPMPGTPPWDYFTLSHPIDTQLPFHGKRDIKHDTDYDNIRHDQEDDGILELEGDRSSMNEKDGFGSDEDFDQTPEVKYQEEDNNILSNSTSEIDEHPDVTPSQLPTSAAAFSSNAGVKDNAQDHKLGAKEIFLCINEIEKLFAKAFESGLEVPKMLEANKMQYRPLSPTETANKPKVSAYLTACFVCCIEEAAHPEVTAKQEIKYLTWHRSVSSNSSSFRNRISVPPKDGIGDLSGNLYGSVFIDLGGHASTLDRLFAWEKKLYQEVKASGVIRREYDIKCRLLRDQESRGENSQRIDKTRAIVKDLHFRVRVAIHRIDSLSKRIEEMRDKELQPQLEELIGSLSRMWELMLHCHKKQYNIISTACNSGSTKVLVRSETQHQATILLDLELNHLCSSFSKWISAQISYLEAIYGWLLKCVFPLKRPKSKKKQQHFSPRRDIAPPIYVTCRDWLLLLEKLPTGQVEYAIRDLVNVLTKQYLPRPVKLHGNSKLQNLPFSKPHEAGKPEPREDIHRSETSFTWNLSYDGLLSGLEAFLDRLDTFAESSVEMYESLKISVHEARVLYESK